MDESKNLRLLGHNDLAGQGRCGEGTSLFASRGRRYLYVAHERAPINFSVLDVSDPRSPTLVHQLELPHDAVRSNSLAIAGDTLVVAYQVARPGLEPAGIELFDLSTPSTPRPIGRLDLSGPRSKGTHWVGCVDGRYAYLSTGTPDSEPRDERFDRFVVVVDLLDPGHPVEVGRWWLPGTQEGDDEPAPTAHPRFDGGCRPHNIHVQPARPDRAYVAYTDGGVVILDIADKASPRLVSRLQYHPPMNGFSHTALPLHGRGLLAITDECVRDGGADHPKNLWIADISFEQRPLILSAAPLPPLGQFAHRGGRFGAHNLHENEPFEWSWQSEEVLFGSFFNAGVRAFDVSDPFRPLEVASFIPDRRSSAPSGGPEATQVNDVFVDAEGIVYATERSGDGVFVLQFEGA